MIGFDTLELQWKGGVWYSHTYIHKQKQQLGVKVGETWWLWPEGCSGSAERRRPRWRWRGRMMMMMLTVSVQSQGSLSSVFPFFLPKIIFLRSWLVETDIASDFMSLAFRRTFRCKKTPTIVGALGGTLGKSVAGRKEVKTKMGRTHKWALSYVPAARLIMIPLLWVVKLIYKDVNLKKWLKIYSFT